MMYENRLFLSPVHLAARDHVVVTDTGTLPETPLPPTKLIRLLDVGVGHAEKVTPMVALY
jgi:hypothetical protein